ncbi:MAG TPA: DinB family protein [Anaerolineales bacterium]|nr:DinB family protein [Anaerolineales bacterium]
MIFQVGLENNNEGRSIAWALEHPGCYAYSVNAEGALLNLESALSRYAGWILHHDTRTWLSFSDSEIETVVNGTWDVYYVNDELDKTTEIDGFSIEAFFPYDWKPLTALEIKHAQAMLVWSREDLLKPVLGLSQEKRNAVYTGERWSINGILGHVGGATYWYLDRLGMAFPREQLPEDPQARFEKVHDYFSAALPKMEGMKKVVGVEGELWSPRKALRRALWHERDHTEHIRKLL